MPLLKQNNFLLRMRFDPPILYALLGLAVISLFILYSASGKSLAAVISQLVRFGLAFVVMLAIAQIRPEQFQRYAPHLYGIGLALLVIVLIIGIVGKGAQRWISLGPLTLQPSEILKIALPMVVAWWLARDSLPPRYTTLAIATVIIMAPVALILKQPDLGTAALILASGLVVIFLAGLSWKIIAALMALLAGSAPVIWSMMHGYQQRRVLTFLNPESDPLGAGYNIIQSKIAVGSGGFFGKGWGDSSQAALGYLPERTTDFIFAVYAEEFGLIGALILFGLYALLIFRGIMITFHAQDAFSRLLCGSLTFTFFLYVFVNIGMVTGLLPVVGVPLPIVSHGGTSLVTLMASFGILMSIHKHRRIVQH